MKKNLMTTAMSVSLLATGVGQAAGGQVQTIDVPEQPLDVAINELSRETGSIIVAQQAVLRDKKSRAVKGEFTAHEALMSMIAGSGLAILELPDRSFTLTEAASSQDGDFLLDQVVIEGERSDRPLAETPASIVVVTGEQADQPSNTNLVDAISGIPNVYADPTNFRLPTIRGIEPTAGAVGGGAITSGAQARVNVIVDGVARPQQAAGTVTANFGTWDTEQIEVARGPQSTLGGRNSLAGNVRIQTKDPVHFFESAIRGFYFNQDGTFGGAGLLNVPVVKDQVALRVTAEATEGTSFIDYTNPLIADIADDYETNDFERYRGKLLITPDDLPGLEFQLLTEFNRTQSAVDNVADAGTFVNTAGPDSLVVFFDNDQFVISPELTYAFTDKIELKAQYSYVDNENAVPEDFSDVTGFPVTQNLETHFVEVFVRAQDISVLNRGVVGVTFESSDDDIDGAFIPFGDFAADGVIENFGVYAEGEFALHKKLALILGGRVEKQTETRIFSFDSPFFGGGIGDLDNDETVFIPKAGLRYDLNENVTLGYQYSEGFRAGGLDFDFIDPAGGFTTFESETLRQHEIYTRTSFLDERLTLNGSAFYYKLEDAQTPGAAAIGLFLRGNLPEVRGLGLELDGTYDFGRGFTASAGLGLLDTEITDAGDVVPEFEGDEAPFAPNVTANFGLDYASDNGFDAFVRVRYVAGLIDSLGGAEIPSFTTIDLGAGYEHETGKGHSFRIDAFVNNVNNDRIVTGVFDGQELLGRPRTFGVSGTIKF
ncbi:MAG: TonB-dependent receptor [Pseudomonadota bacterium]